MGERWANNGQLFIMFFPTIHHVCYGGGGGIFEKYHMFSVSHIFNIAPENFFFCFLKKIGAHTELRVHVFLSFCHLLGQGNMKKTQNR